MGIEAGLGRALPILLLSPPGQRDEAWRLPQG